MAEFPAMPFYTDAYLGDTMHLTTIEHGAYLLLLLAMWRSGGSLPDDDRLLARYARLTNGQWARMAPTIRAFFKAENGTLTQGRLTETYEAVRQRSHKASDSAASRWLKNNGMGDANASETQSERIATKTKTKKEEEDARAREAEFFDQLRSAVGAFETSAYWSDDVVAVHVEQWRDAGLTEAQILAAAEASRSRNPEPPNGPKALDAWMAQTAKALASAAEKPAQAARSAPTANPPMAEADRLAMWAERLNGEGYVPPSAVSVTTARALVAKGLVDPDNLKRRGIAA